MKIGPAVKQLQESESNLAERFREVGERHPSEHDVYHLARRFANECERHAERLTAIAERRGTDAGECGPFGSLREQTDAIPERRPETGVLLLRELRELYVAAQETLVTWVIVNQGAMAARDQEVLEIAKECYPETELQVKWLLTRIKVTAPQALAS